MDDMVERVAKALFQNYAKEEGRDPLEWEDAPDHPWHPWREHWRNMARIAINAMNGDDALPTAEHPPSSTKLLLKTYLRHLT